MCKLLLLRPLQTQSGLLAVVLTKCVHISETGAIRGPYEGFRTGNQVWQAKLCSQQTAAAVMHAQSLCRWYSLADSTVFRGAQYDPCKCLMHVRLTRPCWALDLAIVLASICLQRGHVLGRFVRLWEPLSNPLCACVLQGRPNWLWQGF